MNRFAGFIPPVILAVIGLSCWAWGFISSMSSLRGSGLPVSAPGITTVSITNVGDYTLWNQTKGIVNGQFKSFPESLNSAMSIKVTKLPEQTQIPVSTTMNSTIDINGTHRISVVGLTFDKPGQYQINVSGLPEKRAFYLDEAKFLRAFSAIMVGGAAGLFFIFGSVVWGIFALIRLLTGKKR